MIRVKKGAEFDERGFRFVEADGTMTSLSVWQEMDLSIQQKRPGQEPTGFSTYSDPGTTPYALILRFLALNRVRLPREPLSSKKKVLFANAKWGNDTEHSQALRVDWKTSVPLPAQFTGGFPHLLVEAHWIKHGPHALLEFNYAGHPTAVRLSLPLARKLAEYIPKVYAGADVSIFKAIHRAMDTQIRTGTLFRGHDMPEVRPFQHEFRFPGRPSLPKKKGRGKRDPRTRRRGR